MGRKESEWGYWLSEHCADGGGYQVATGTHTRTLQEDETNRCVFNKIKLT
jgi:hypothetical protein